MIDQEYSERRMSVYMALYAYANDNHEGQWSRSYRLLCSVQRKGFRPGVYGIKYEDLDPPGQVLYDMLVERNY